MDEALREKLQQLKFTTTDMAGAMRVKLEGGIEVRAVTHPLYGLVLLGSHFDGRRMTEFEVRLLETVSTQEIAQALVHIYEQAMTPNILEVLIRRLCRINAFRDHAKSLPKAVICLVHLHG